MNREECEHNEVDAMEKEADSTGEVMHNVKERLVICRPNEEDTGGRARVARDEERVLPVD